jgi:hypothetical protein
VATFFPLTWASTADFREPRGKTVDPIFWQSSETSVNELRVNQESKVQQMLHIEIRHAASENSHDPKLYRSSRSIALQYITQPLQRLLILDCSLSSSQILCGRSLIVQWMLCHEQTSRFWCHKTLRRGKMSETPYCQYQLIISPPFHSPILLFERKHLSSCLARPWQSSHPRYSLRSLQLLLP